MDPNAALAELRTLIAEVNEDGPYRFEKLERIADLTEALDNWISNGGFLPDAWNKGR